MIAAGSSCRVGIVTALPAEVAALTATTCKPGRVTEIAPGIAVYVAGVGPQRAREAARALIDAGAQMLVSWGTAAALHTDIQAGDLILPRYVSGADSGTYTTDANLRLKMVDGLMGEVRVRDELLVLSDELLSSVEAKAATAKATGAIAADMESGAVGEVAGQAGLPFLVVRAISDTVEMILPRAIAKATNQQGQFQLGRFLWEAAIRPGEWGAIGELAKTFRQAEATLKSMAPRVLSLGEAQVAFGQDK